MDNLSLFILLIIILLVIFIYFSGYHNNFNDTNANSNKKKSNSKYSVCQKRKEKMQKNGNYYIHTDDNKYLDKMITTSQTCEVLPYFVEMQFHNDYKDVITAFDKMTETTGKPLFNRSNEPVKYTPLTINDGEKFMNTFLNELNQVLKNKILDVVDLENGWNNIQDNPNVENGWEKQMKQLGLPPNLYNKGSKRDIVTLVRIDKVDKFETDSQIRHDVYCIIQKGNTLDQIVVKISFLMNRHDLNNDRNFFNDDKTVDLDINLESVFIVGFMTDHSYGSTNKNTRQDFYTFENIEKDGMMDQEEIFKQLKKKYQNYQIEANGLTTQVDPNTGNNLAIQRLSVKTPIYPQ
jgi:hypothetical protein